MWLLVACTSMPYRASTQDAAAKSYAVAPGSAAIYVYWPGSRRADQPGIPVTIDGRAIGHVFSGTFMLHTVAPGEHDVWVGRDAATSHPRLDPLRFRLVHLPVRALAAEAVFVRAELSDAAHRVMEPALAKTELSTCCILIEADTPPATRLFR
jgi:hypothetical protein